MGLDPSQPSSPALLSLSYLHISGSFTGESQAHKRFLFLIREIMLCTHFNAISQGSELFISKTASSVMTPPTGKLKIIIQFSQI